MRRLLQPLPGRLRVGPGCRLPAALAVVLLAACEPAPPAEFRVGLIGVYAGTMAGSSGIPARQGADLAVERLNAAGGVVIGGRPHRVVLIERETDNRPDAAALAARALINLDSVDVVIGPQTSNLAIAAAPVAEVSQVPMITPMASNPAVTAGRRMVVRLAFVDAFQGEVLARFAYDSLGLRRAAALHDAGSAYGREITRLFRETFESLGGKVVRIETFDADDPREHSPHVRRILAERPDAILLPSFVVHDSAQIRVARAMGFRGRFLGSDTWDLLALASREDALGSFVVANWNRHADRAASREFLALFDAKYPDGQARATGAATFDAILLAAEAASRAGVGQFTDFSTFVFTTQAGAGGNEFIPFVNSRDQYNFGPINHYMRPDRRYNLGASGHYEINDNVDVYSRFAYTNYESNAQIAPAGIFFDASTINCGNPLLSAQQSGAIGCTPAMVAADDSTSLYIGRRNVEGGARQQRFKKSVFSGMLGARGDISSNWQYDVSAQFSSGVGSQETENYFVKDRIKRALDVIDVAGVPTCRAATSVGGAAPVDPACIPYNVFDPNGVTPDQLGYMQATGLQNGSISQEVYVGQVTGDLGFKLPTAEETVKVAFGAEYRRDTLINTVDAIQEANGLSGAGGATIGISGATKVVDLFGEVQVPLVQDKAFFDSLALDGAYRYSDYGDVTTDTYKLGLEWAPVRDIKFRGSFQRAVRAANIVELFTAQGNNLFDADGDPCGVSDPNPNATLAECVATGMPAAAYRTTALDSPAGQYNFLQGGNTALTPEESDTQTMGVILQPRFLPKFSMSVDWFNIQIDDTISTIGSTVTFDACYTGNDPTACARIQRNPNSGNLWAGDVGKVIDLNTNIGSLETTGYDINMNYAGLEIGAAGSLSFNLTGTYLEELVTDPGSPGTETYDCAGKFSSSCASGTAGVPSPRWRHHARLGWQSPWPLDMSLTWRYFSEVSLFGVPETSARIDRTLDAQSYIDLAGNYAITDKASVLVGINNILDEDPPLSGSVGTTGNGNTYPQLYDALGRFIFVRASIAF